LVDKDGDSCIFRCSRSNANRLRTPRDEDITGLLSEQLCVCDTNGEDDDEIGCENIGVLTGDVDKGCLENKNDKQGYRELIERF
jgi:hypothetical protein